MPSDDPSRGSSVEPLLDVRPRIVSATRMFLAMASGLAVVLSMIMVQMAARADAGLYASDTLIKLCICVGGAYLGLAPGIYFVYYIERRRKWVVYEDRIELYDGDNLLKTVPWDDVVQVWRFMNLLELTSKRYGADRGDPTLNEHLDNHRIAFVDSHSAAELRHMYQRRRRFSPLP